MDAIAALSFGYIDDSIAIEISLGISEIHGERRAQSMLRLSVRISVKGGEAYAMS